MMLLIRRANQKGTIVVKTQLIPKKKITNDLNPFLKFLTMIFFNFCRFYDAM